jgi:glyoxylase-like metal-dependent hydrolase (beta-lactamase superfamily II)
VKQGPAPCPLREAGNALPHPGYDPSSYRVLAAPVTRNLTEGHVVDIGDRTLSILHLPGHSPGSIALFDEHSGTLFSGDVIYDGKILDTLAGSDINDYLMTMARLRELDARTIHPGHGASFNTRCLHRLIDAYIQRTGR